MSVSRRKPGHAETLSAKAHKEGSLLAGRDRRETGLCLIEMGLLNSPPK
jgi:hypothetical protein